MAVRYAVRVEVHDRRKLAAIGLLLEQVTSVADPLGLVAAVVVRSELAENQWDTGVTVRELHQRLDDVLERRPRVAVATAVLPVVGVGTNEVDHVGTREPLVCTTTVARATFSQLETEVRHYPREVYVVGALGLKDLVELAERGSVIIGVTELRGIAGLGFVVENERDGLAVAGDPAGEVLHLAIDPRSRLSVCDRSPCYDFTVVALGLDRDCQIAPAISNPAVQVVVGADVVVPVGEVTYERKLRTEVAFKCFEGGDIALTVYRSRECAEADTVGQRVGFGVAVGDCPDGNRHRNECCKHL